MRIGGKRVIRGGNNIADGPVDDENIQAVMEAVHTRGFGNLEETNTRFRDWSSNYVSLVFRVCLMLKLRFLG